MLIEQDRLSIRTVQYGEVRPVKISIAPKPVAALSGPSDDGCGRAKSNARPGNTIGECEARTRTLHQLRTPLRPLTRQYRLNLSPFNSIGPVRARTTSPTNFLPTTSLLPASFFVIPHIPSNSAKCSVASLRSMTSQLGTTRPPTPCLSLMLLTPWRTRKIPTIPHPCTSFSLSLLSVSSLDPS